MHLASIGPFDYRRSPAGKKDPTMVFFTAFFRATRTELHKDHAPIALQVPLISNIIYDIRLPPSCLRSAPNAPLRIASSADLDIPFAPSRPASIRIISREFPWAIAVSEGTRGAGVSCWEVLVALYDSLQMPLADHEWGFSSDDLRQRMVRAWKLRESAGSGQAALLKRVDLLGGRCMLQGFRRDGEFTAQRLYPGTRLVPDTWTVCFVHKIN
jgi:hypothetical protein